MEKKVILTLSIILFIMLYATLGTAAEQAEPRVTIDLYGHPFKGPANAPVIVVVFSDYL